LAWGRHNPTDSLYTGQHLPERKAALLGHGQGIAHDRLAGRVARRDQDRRYILQGRILPLHGQELKAIHARHDQVEQDHVSGLLVQDLQGALPIACRQNPVAAL